MIRHAPYRKGKIKLSVNDMRHMLRVDPTQNACQRTDGNFIHAQAS